MSRTMKIDRLSHIVSFTGTILWFKSIISHITGGTARVPEAMPAFEEARPDDSNLNIPLKQPKYCYQALQDAVPARVVLYLLSFSGFLVSFMMRTDINIAIVAMVKLPPPLPKTDTAGDDPLVCYDHSTITNSSDESPVHSPEEGEFDWDATVQGAILGSFYWCYILSQVVGGMLTQKFGTKAVFGYSQLATAACSLLIPTAADIHYGVIILLRSIQGVASGLTWPAMYAIVGQWIPAIERSRFMSSFQGFSFGIGLTYPLAGFIIAHSGWRLVFYTTGTIGALWCIFWYLFAFDSPHKHPRITKQELEYIQSNIGNSVQGGQSMKVPWTSIMTSLPAWAIGITTFGRIWVHYTFIIPGPMYMKTVLGFSIQKNGVLSGLPFLLSYLSSVVFCYVADFLVTRNLISLTNVRKIFTAMSQVIPGLMLLAIGYLGCNITLVLVIWFIAVSLITASYAGAMASVVDIGPNLAGPILAFAQTIHMTASFLSPIVAGFILKHNTSLEQWRKVFWVASCVACGTYVFFQIFGTSKVQPWNYPDGRIPEEDLEPLSKRKATRRDSADFATDG
ncbi:sialin-like isoform X2 [Macrosteles quadrilineatus]|uniref:sialin-like isoform X2 n=1 Tax=Macrosteles quadrilineatus TaxID=74068 RepID=UPI0023E15713|nr:sialin-like isoform X2 [Macrosteles quadrilineatus]XP_054267537.1 sialin-like isoform X2 [Macrosteles quadrilineatus]